MIHYRSSPGIPVSTCGERGLDLRFSIKRSEINCQVCIERHAAGAKRRQNRFDKTAVALKMRRDTFRR